VLKPYKSSAKNKSAKLVPSAKEFLNTPAPKIIFQGRSFCFTGVFDFAAGDRNQCEAETKRRGGFCYERPNRALNYLVVGNYAEPSWVHGSFGRKIIAVLDFKSSGEKCQIISEELWSKSLQATPESRQEGQDQKKTDLMTAQQAFANSAAANYASFSSELDAIAGALGKSTPEGKQALNYRKHLNATTTHTNPSPTPPVTATK